jgi:hypothetical protein
VAATGRSLPAEGSAAAVAEGGPEIRAGNVGVGTLVDASALECEGRSAMTVAPIAQSASAPATMPTDRFLDAGGRPV